MKNIIKKAASKVKTGVGLIKRGFVEDPVNAYLTGLFTASAFATALTIVGCIINAKTVGNAANMYNSGLQAGCELGEKNTVIATVNYLIGQGKSQEEAFSIVNSLVNNIKSN